MSEYSRIDLLRFHRFANENKDLKPLDLLKQYDLKVPRLTEEEKRRNLLKAIGLSDPDLEGNNYWEMFDKTYNDSCPKCESKKVRISYKYEKSLCVDCGHKWCW